MTIGTFVYRGKPINRTLLAAALILILAHCHEGLAQDATITNLDELARVAFSDSMYIPFSPWQWRAYSLNGVEPWWVDCSALPCTGLVSASTNYTLQGVDIVPAWLTKSILSGETVLQAEGATDVVARTAAPSGYQPGQLAYQDGMVWRTWQQASNCPDCWGIEGAFPSPTVGLRVFLADANDYATYESNVEAEAEAEAEAQAASASSFAMRGRFTMSEDEDDGGEGYGQDNLSPCTVTNGIFGVLSVTRTTNGWTTLVAGPTCTNYMVGWFSADVLTTNVQWGARSGGWAGNATTSWIDPTTTNANQRFYRAIRILPTQTSDWNGDGIPDIWEANQGLNPFDPTDASQTSTNPWAHGLTNLQVYENPSVLITDNYSSVGDGIPDWWRVKYFGTTTNNNFSCATCDPDGDGLINLMEYLLGTDPLVYDAQMDTIVNGGAPYTPSLTISIQSLSTNFPGIRVSTDPLMSNATVLAFSSGFAYYTLPDDGDGLYDLYLQYADAGGLPHGVVLTKTVTLDRVPPTVYIAGPASNAVLNQAFMTLQAVAYDADPFSGNDTRPLSLWINGQPFWNRAGTNIVVERFPVPFGTNAFTVTIQAADQAGHTNQATQTWSVNPSTATNMPVISRVNLVPDGGVPGGAITAPETSSFWVQGNVSNENEIVTATVNGGTPIPMAVVGNQFGVNLPLEPGTNTVLLIAAESSGKAATNSYSVISADRFQAVITSPAFGSFANGQSNVISGYVSGVLDAGLPTQTNLVSVTVNGVSATLNWNNMDAYGNVPFTTTSGVPPPAWGDPFEPLNLQSTWADGEQFTTSVGLQNGYEVIALQTEENYPEPALDSDGLERPISPCNNAWKAYLWYNDAATNAYDLTIGNNLANVTPYSASRQTNGGCTSDPESDPSIWGLWNSYEQSASYQTSARGLSFGAERYYVFVQYDSGRQQMVPWPSLTTASLSFRAPVQYDTNTTVIFTFEGVNYTRPASIPLDLSQVNYLGQSPIAWSNQAGSVSYLIAVDGGAQYTVNQDSFQWPGFTTNYVQRVAEFQKTVYIATSNHSLSWTNFHNAHPTIVGSPYLVSTTDAVGSNITLTATNYLSYGTFQWSTTSPNIQFAGSTTARTLTVSPVQGRFTPPGSNEVVTLVYTLQDWIVTNTFSLIVQRPSDLKEVSRDSTTQNGLPSLKVAYQILDQNGQPLRCVVPVGSARVRIATLLASEELTWQCNTSCSGLNTNAHDIIVFDDGTFNDTQKVLINICQQGYYVRSQVLLVGINAWPYQDIIGYKCICFDGTSFSIVAGSSDGTACCNSCQH